MTGAEKPQSNQTTKGDIPMKKYNFRYAFSATLPTETLEAITRRYWNDENLSPNGAFSQAALAAYRVIEERKNDYELDGKAMVVRVNRHIRKNLQKCENLYGFPKQSKSKRYSYRLKYPVERWD